MEPLASAAVLADGEPWRPLAPGGRPRRMERCARDQQGLRQRPQTAERLLALAVDDIDDLNEQADRHDLEVDDIPYPAGRDEYVVYQFRDRSGRVLLRSHDAPQGPFEVPLCVAFQRAGEGASTRK